MNPPRPFDDERLARLLSLLRPAPQEWVAKAQRIPLERADEGLTDRDLAELGQKLELDAAFRQRFDADPVAAAEGAGMHELAAQLQREIRQLVALAERIARDDDPIAVLAAAGLPEETTEPLLRALAMPEDVLAKLPEVSAHRHRRPPLKARLLMLLLGSATVGNKLRAAAAG